MCCKKEGFSIFLKNDLSKFVAMVSSKSMNSKQPYKFLKKSPSFMGFVEILKKLKSALNMEPSSLTISNIIIAIKLIFNIIILFYFN